MKTALFDIRHLYYLPQFLPVIEELLKRNNYAVYVTVSVNESVEKENYLNKIFYHKQVHVIREKTDAKRLAKCSSLNPDILFVGNVRKTHPIANDQTLTVMIYHGIGLKTSYYKDTSPQIDVYAIESQERMDHMLSKGFNKDQLALCGFTKLDPLIKSKNRDQKDLLRELKLNEDKKTVFYTPTFYPSSIEKTVKSLVNHDFDFNLIIKMHQFSWQMKKYRYHIDAIQKLGGKENVYIVDKANTNIIDYYLISDLLLTDISSTLFEFLILNRPIVQCLDFTFRNHHKLFPWLVNKRFDKARMKKVDFTYQIKDANLLVELINKTLRLPEELTDERTKAISEFHYLPDGNASSRLLDFIEAKLMDS
ncbi:MAG: CDP-glycerol glycerophosphotransferase family protein [Fidelibacterota bacterium]